MVNRERSVNLLFTNYQDYDSSQGRQLIEDGKVERKPPFSYGIVTSGGIILVQTLTAPITTSKRLVPSHNL
jgi:hypothetical protein